MALYNYEYAIDKHCICPWASKLQILTFKTAEKECIRARTKMATNSCVCKICSMFAKQIHGFAHGDINNPKFVGNRVDNRYSARMLNG